MDTPFATDYFQTKSAFWGGAIHGIGGVPLEMGQRAAVRASPRELTDEEYNRVTGGFDNAASAVPRAVGHSILGALGGAALGGALGAGAEMIDGGNVTGDTMVPSMAAGGIIGGLGAGVRGTYTAGRDITAENIQHLDDGATQSTLHPVRTGVGRVLSIAPIAMSPLSAPVNAAMGAIGHGANAMIGRSHSDTRRSDMPAGAMPKMASVKLPEHFMAI